MLALAWIISVVAASTLGFYLRDLENYVDLLATKIADKLVPAPAEVPHKPTVTMIDGDDIELTVKYETEEMHRRLNNHIYPNDRDK